jgi:hypothetical protein
MYAFKLLHTQTHTHHLLLFTEKPAIIEPIHEHAGNKRLRHPSCFLCHTFPSLLPYIHCQHATDGTEMLHNHVH